MRLSELESKIVVDIRNGKKIGQISDLEFDEKNMCICYLIVCEFSWKDFVMLFSKPRMKKISVDQIVCVGKDVILVKC